MKRTTRASLMFLLPLSIVIAGLWLWTYWATPRTFSVKSRRIVPSTTPSFAIGQQFAAMIAPDGSLWAWSDEPAGVNLGIIRGSTPHKISDETDWRQITASAMGLLALKRNGSLWVVGENHEGIFGIANNTATVESPTRVGSATDWKEIKAGAAHCMALKNDGSLWTWGQNQYGQIGVGTTSTLEPITRIGFETNWVAIAPGAFHSFALRRDGTIWMWGFNLSASGNSAMPIQLGSETNWTAIAAGDYHLIAQDTAGANWITGPNAGFIESSPPDSTTNWRRFTAVTNWTEIYCGELSVIARDGKGQVHAAGSMRDFYLNKSWPLDERFDPLAIHMQRSTTLFIMPDGRVWSLGLRIGAKAQRSFLQNLQNKFISLVTRKAPPTPGGEIDREPRFVWEQ